jgi:hypothetical protein
MALFKDGVWNMKFHDSVSAVEQQVMEAERDVFERVLGAGMGFSIFLSAEGEGDNRLILVRNFQVRETVECRFRLVDFIQVKTEHLNGWLWDRLRGVS